ncbi:Ff.00g001050.m01.CDS01 [Fusarium sp. VM40]|nr:Ff.00g001050.m01.CDS01 [Fusarium sp. VM40]
MAGLQPLSYTQIPSNHIRLLRLNTDITNPSVGTLEVVDLDQAPPFYALSHSWGTQVQSVAVQVEGNLLYLTPGLSAGLRMFKGLAIEEYSLSPPLRYIWIDSICVNQESLADRSSQVALMRRIYSTSITTLVWLGTELAWGPSAWKLVEQIYDVFHSRHPASQTEADIPVRICSDSSHAETGLPQWDHESWGHLKQLMDIEWFSRIWVVQEVVLSPRDPIIICGNRLYPWHHLHWTSAWMRRAGYMRLPQIPERLLNVNIMGNLRNSLTKWPLDALMSFTQTKFHATDQRDKIFGLLGMAAECQDGSLMPEALRPDYSVDTAQTYLKVARFLLQNGSSLAILTRARGAVGSPMRRQRVYDLAGLPSWAPDWSDFRVFNKGIRASLARVHFSDPEKAPNLGFPDNFNASAGLGIKLYKSDDNSVLRVGGEKLATVTKVYSFDENEVSKDEFELVLESKIRNAWNTFVSSLTSDTADMVTCVTRFIRTTTAERHGLVERSWDQSLKDGMAYLLSLLETSDDRIALSFFNGDKRKSIELLRQLSVGGQSEEYAFLACTYCFNRSFLVASIGNIGIGPSDTQVGDCISVILGGDVPYVIREDWTWWSLVGEMYLDGYMNGEAVRAIEDGHMQEEILEIK